MSSAVDNAISQACYLPLSPDGLPMIGRVPQTSNVFVATGHGCWGILLSPATGAALAELIVKGESNTIDLRPFCPSRFEKVEKSIKIKTVH
eukprot:IDg21176t1